MNKSTQVAGLLLLGFLASGALLLPVSGLEGVALAQAETPRNQTEFDQLAARLDNADSSERNAQLNRAGHAFDNGESRLFWFTDLDAARAQAQRENKPILSLRLLGNLSDEFSCANSRLFRVLLYPNAEINRRLHDDFVLHWSSERPVPVATIDMGDGRVFKRTLTGNSAHYLLSAQGQPLDVLPGLYAPAEFAAWLQRGADFARDWQNMNADLQPKMLSDWHRGRLIDNIKADGSFRPIDEANQIIAANFLASDQPTPPVVSARGISQLALPKRLGEIPILDAMDAPQTVSSSVVKRENYKVPLLGDVPLIGRLFLSKTESSVPLFDAATRARIAAMQPENESQTLIQTLEQNVARDTRNNRRNFEPPIHAYFVNPSSLDSVDKRADFSSNQTKPNPYLSGAGASLIRPEQPSGWRQNSTFGGGETKPNIVSRESPYFADGTTPNFDKLNRAIYDKLFRTPASDPWLGLSPADAFVAIRNGGVQSAPNSGQRVTQNP